MVGFGRFGGIVCAKTHTNLRNFNLTTNFYSENRRFFVTLRRIILLAVDSSSKYSARLMIEALYEYNVRDVVVSPGSRNTPLIIALDAEARIRKHVIIDERSAAFAALGMAIQSGRPAACVCTSGSAVLNYSPAVAEAFYRGIPLIIISADRPAEWIDQDDSQTIHQFGALANIVKGSYDIAVDNATTPDYVNRTLNDALTMALSHRPGPVHINLQFDEPLGMMAADGPTFRPVMRESPIYCNLTLPDIPDDRIMVVAGFHCPRPEYADILFRLWTECGIPVLCEAQSNVRGISATLALKALGEDGFGGHEFEDFAPRLVISVGGAVVSKELKHYLRENQQCEHWYAGYGDHAVDCYRHLSRRFDMDEMILLQALYQRMIRRPATEFGNIWTELFLGAADMAEDSINKMPWSALKAVKMIMDCGARPETDGMCLHLGNGTTVRNAQLCNFYSWREVECNRGVSGIDGSVSTAIGAALAGGDVLLICGDMSAQYDMGALAIADIPDTFRMVVVDNHGGGIFRQISSTSGMDCDMRERYYSGNINLPLRQLAEAFGFDYFEAGSEAELDGCIPQFLSAGRKALMRVYL